MHSTTPSCSGDYYKVHNLCIVGSLSCLYQSFKRRFAALRIYANKAASSFLMIFVSWTLFHIRGLTVNACLTQYLNCVLNTFSQEKALVGTVSVIANSSLTFVCSSTVQCLVPPHYPQCRAKHGPEITSYTHEDTKCKVGSVPDNRPINRNTYKLILIMLYQHALALF